MKRIFLIACVGGILTTSCEKKAENISTEKATQDTNVVVEDATQNNTEEIAAVDPADAPVLSLEQDTYDFGDVEANQLSTKKITFKNTGATPLQIKDAKASCGCTVPKYSKEPIAPGETGELEVAYTAPAMNGKQMKTVTLITNTANVTETFKIAANVVGGREVSKSPAQSTNAPVPNFN